MRARGGDRAEEAADLSLPERVRPHLQAERPVRVHGGANRQAEDAGAAASGDELRERIRKRNGVGREGIGWWRMVRGEGELAVEELEHVVEALGGGLHGRRVAVLEEVLLVFFVIGGVDEAAVGTGMEIGGGRGADADAGAGGGGEEAENIVVWVRWIHERQKRMIRARKSRQKGNYYSVCLCVFMTHRREFYIEK